MASAVDARRFIKNAPLRLYGRIIDYTTGLAIAGGLTGMDAEISADGGAFADLAAAEAEIGTTGHFVVDFAATETAYDQVIFQFKASNTNAITYIEKISFEAASDSGVAQSAAATTIVLRSAASAVDDFYKGQTVEIVRGTGAGQTRMVLYYVGSSKTASLDRAWATNPDNTSVYIVKAVGPVEQSVEYGLAQSATTYGIVLRSGAVATDDYFNGLRIKIVAGTGFGQERTIVDYTGSSKTCVLDRAWITSPDTTSYYTISTLGAEVAIDAGIAQSASSTTIVIRSGALATNDIYNGQQIKITAGTGIGQIRAITDYVGSSKTATIDRAWITNPNATSMYVIGGVQGSMLGTDIIAHANATQVGSSAAAATALAYLYKGGITMGAVNDAGATTTVFIGDSSLSAIDDFYNNALLVFVTGALAGETEKISDYVGSTKTITMSHAFAASPANADQFVIFGKIR